MTKRNANVLVLSWLIVSTILLCVAVACTGCMRQPLDMSTAQVLHVARVEMGGAARAWDADVQEADNVQFHAALDAARKRMKADPARIDETMAQVEQASQKFSRDRQAAASRLANFQGYLDLLHEVEAGYLQLYNRTNSLKAMFTGNAAPELTIPEAPAGTPPTLTPK